MFFIDESGSIPKQLDMRYKHKYFVICFVHTSNPSRLGNVYKNAMRDLRRHFPDIFSNIDDPRELKGSEAYPFMKMYIIQKLLLKTDIKIAHMVVDNWEIEQRFRNIPGRSFNFLIKIILDNFRLHSKDKEHLELYIDNRNTALEGLRELEGYLFNELVLESCKLDEVSVTYLDSKYHKGIQVADMISHIIYQRFRYKTLPFPMYSEITNPTTLSHPYTYEYLYQLIKPRIVLPYVYPPSKDFIKEAATATELF